MRGREEVQALEGRRIKWEVGKWGEEKGEWDQYQ